MQGLAIYTVIALLVSFEELYRTTGAAARTTKGEAGGTFQVFVKQGDEIRPISLDQIVTIRGADDYSEIDTGSAKHLVRMTLANFEARLGDPFLRVHRSYIVNAARIERAEPAGAGRLLLHMANGATVQTSRSGARLVRERVI
jgi:DNA-binding LytR/AlgR family response regulator